MNSDSLPVHRVAVVRPFVNLLADIGAPVERGFQQANLPWNALESVNNYVPSHCFWKFLISMARSEGLLDLGFRVGDRYGADCADPKMTALLKKAPTLYRGLLGASALVNRTITHCRLGILQPPDSGYAYFYHQPSCKADNPALEQIGWYGLTTLLAMVRTYTGPQWLPAEIGLMTDRMPSRDIRERFPNTRMKLSQAASYIVLDNSVLSLPPLNTETAVSVSNSPEYVTLPAEFVGALEQVLLSYVQESDLNIELAAGLCNLSKRSLQRRLKEEGTHYHEVQDHVRYRAASRMLQNPAMRITDIACHLGYSNVAHFARAFRRIAGVTPRVYRQQYHQ